METVLQDLRHALRYWRTRPGSAAAVAVTVALGIGAATATFGLVNAVLLRPLPVREQDRLVVLRAENRAQRNPHVALSNGIVWDLAAHAHALGDVAGVQITSPLPFVARDRDRPFSVGLTLVTGRFFRVLGVTPALGRVWQDDAELLNAAPAAVISYSAWRREFGGDSSVIGRQLEALPGGPHTIMGVTPPGFDYPRGTELWLDDAQLDRHFAAARTPEGGWWDVVGRLREGVTLEQAHAELDAYFRHSSFPRLGAPATRAAVVESFNDSVVGSLKPALYIVCAAVALVLLIACSNAGGLLLTRGLSRVAELGIRSALGASRERIVGQLLLEHAVLGCSGGLLGLALGAAALKVVLSLAPAELPRIHEAHLDAATLVFVAAVSLGSVLLFGVAPALVATRGDLTQALHGTSRTTGGPRAGLARRLIVSGQVALALVVLAGGGLLARSLARIEHLDLGFEPDRLLFVGLELLEPPPAPADTAARARLAARYWADVDALASQLPHQPGIAAVTTTIVLPFSGTTLDLPYALDGPAGSDTARPARAAVDEALDDYFGTLGTPVVRGRGITAADRAGGPLVVVVNQTFAQQAWPGQDPIGRRIRLIPADSTQPWRTVVGVAADGRYWDVTSVRPTIYVPLRQFTQGGGVAFWAIRAARDPEAALPAVKRVLREVDPSLSVRKVVTGRELAAGPRARPRFLAATVGTLSLIAVALAAVGLFAVLAVYVRQHGHELAIRTALGAAPWDVRALVLRHATRMVAGGIVVGLVLVLGTSRVLRAVLFEVSPTDAATLAFVTVLLLVVALIASYVPARRAMRVDPMVVLRAE